MNNTGQSSGWQGLCRRHSSGAQETQGKRDQASLANECFLSTSGCSTISRHDGGHKDDNT